MRKTFVASVMGLLLLSLGSAGAQVQLEVKDSQSRAEVRQELPLQARQAVTPVPENDKVDRSKSGRVKGVTYYPRGRGRYDRAPEPKPVIYVKGFETYGGR